MRDGAADRERNDQWASRYDPMIAEVIQRFVGATTKVWNRRNTTDDLKYDTDWRHEVESPSGSFASRVQGASFDHAGGGAYTIRTALVSGAPTEVDKILQLGKPDFIVTGRGMDDVEHEELWVPEEELCLYDAMVLRVSEVAHFLRTGRVRPGSTWPGVELPAPGGNRFVMHRVRWPELCRVVVWHDGFLDEPDPTPPSKPAPAAKPPKPPRRPRADGQLGFF